MRCARRARGEQLEDDQFEDQVGPVFLRPEAAPCAFQNLIASLNCHQWHDTFQSAWLETVTITHRCS